MEKLFNNNLCNALWMYASPQEYLGTHIPTFFFWGGGGAYLSSAPQSDFAHPTEIGIRSHCLPLLVPWHRLWMRNTIVTVL